MRSISGLLFAAAAFWLVLWCSQEHGLGVNPDSVIYMEVAQALRDKAAVTDLNGRFVNEWPPGFPLAVAIVANATNSTIADAGRYLNAILLALLVILFTLICRLLEIRVVMAIPLILLLLLSPVSRQYAWFLSEGLFFTLLMIALLFHLMYFRTARPAWIIAAALFAGWMCLVRYAGVGIVAGMLLYLFLDRASIRSSFSRGLVFSATFLAALIPWIVYSWSQGQPPAEREMVFHPMSMEALARIFKNPLSWFMPGRLTAVSSLLFIAAFVVLLIFKTREGGKIIQHTWTTRKKEILAMLIPAGTYVLFILFTINFLDANVPVDERILSPVCLLLLIALGCFLNDLLLSKWWGGLALAFCVLIGFSSGTASIGYWQHLHIRGKGFASLQWKRSEALSWVRNSPDQIVYTNAWDALRFHEPEMVKRIRKLPRMVIPATLAPDPDLDLELDRMHEEVLKGNAVIIHFDKITWRKYLVGREVLSEWPDVQKIDLADGTVFINRQASAL